MITLTLVFIILVLPLLNLIPVRELVSELHRITPHVQVSANSHRASARAASLPTPGAVEGWEGVVWGGGEWEEEVWEVEEWEVTSMEEVAVTKVKLPPPGFMREKCTTS